MRRLLQAAAFVVLAALTAGALVSSATSATMRAGYTTGPSGTTGPTGKTPTPTASPTRTATPTPTPITICCKSSKQAPRLSFKILKGATAKRLTVAAKVSRQSKVAFTVRNNKRAVGSKRGAVKKRKTFKIGLQTAKIGSRRPVKLTVVGQATAGAKKSRLVTHSVTIR